MSIVVISRMPYSKGKDIATELANQLDYQCVSRDDLAAASTDFNISATEVLRAQQGAPSFLDRFTHGKERYHTFIRESFLERILGDNIVYHGLSSHVFVKGVKNILKVGIVANSQDRIKAVMEAKNYSWDRARSFLQKKDKGQNSWSHLRYGIDTRDPRLYDVILHINSLSVSTAVETLRFLVQTPAFQTTSESMQQVSDLLSAAKMQTRLVDYFPKASVNCEDGTAHVRVSAPRLHQDKIMAQVRQLIGEMDGINDLQIKTTPIYHPD